LFGKKEWKAIYVKRFFKKNKQPYTTSHPQDTTLSKVPYIKADASIVSGYGIIYLCATKYTSVVSPETLLLRKSKVLSPPATSSSSSPIKFYA
jgi:hypothetical protein